MVPSLFLTGKIMGSGLKYKVERNIHDRKRFLPVAFCSSEEQLVIDVLAQRQISLGIPDIT